MRNKYKGDDIKGRLGSTIIRYKGHPYFCDVEGTILALYDLENGSLIVRVDPDDPFIDISSLTLGYVNLYNKEYRVSVYLKREGLRQYKQGVDLGRLTQFVLKGTGAQPQINAKALQCKGLVECVHGKYPSLSDGIDYVTNKGFHSIALSRNVAIKRETDLLKIFVKTDEVGYMRLGTTRLMVPKMESSFINLYFLKEISGWEIIEGTK